MKRVANAVCLLLALGLIVMGCGKEPGLEGKAVDGKGSGLEGKVLDGKGNPISGMKMIAKQVKPLKGDEQREATTGSDGSFKFSGLFQTSDYTLAPSMPDAKFSASVNIKSGSEGETIMLPKPFSIRFMQTKDGIIKDSVTGLQWLPDLGREDIKWDDAQVYVQGLKSGGFSDWRLPSRAELKSLYDPSISAEYKIDPLFQLSSCCPLTGELAETSNPWIISFISGNEFSKDNSGYKKRVLAVRSLK